MKKRPMQRWTLAAIKEELARAGKVGEIFVEGDLCRRIWQPYAENFMCGDDMDYNPDAGVPLKKALMRLERTCPFPCSTSLWRTRADFPGSGEALLWGTHASVYDTDKPRASGYVPPPMRPEMEAVFLRGRRAWRVSGENVNFNLYFERGLKTLGEGFKKNAAVQYFVPVKDSLGDIAAALEVFTIVEA
jgi:hypothetical protein